MFCIRAVHGVTLVTPADQCCLGSRNVCIVNDIIVRNVILLKRDKKKKKPTKTAQLMHAVEGESASLN